MVFNGLLAVVQHISNFSSFAVVQTDLKQKPANMEKKILDLRILKETTETNKNTNNLKKQRIPT